MRTRLARKEDSMEDSISRDERSQAQDHAPDTSPLARLIQLLARAIVSRVASGETPPAKDPGEDNENTRAHSSDHSNTVS